MNAKINSHQLNQLILYITKKYQSFASQSAGDKIVFDRLENPHLLAIRKKKPIISFEKILLPSCRSIDELPAKNLAFLGFSNCDAVALDKLLQVFAKTPFLPKRQDILVVTTECRPDENCFCNAFGYKTIKSSDLHIQTEESDYSVHSLSKAGNQILLESGFRQTAKEVKIKEIISPNNQEIDKKKLQNCISDKQANLSFWQGISKNCFGCGACSTVCPLCFCFRQDYGNEIDGSCHHCLRADSCFSPSFSEIQHGFNYRPENTDRLYNWYHHKFVREPETSGETLCSGCGRCIDACPANLNQYRILLSLNKEKTNE